MTILIRPETRSDFAAIEHIHRTAFGGHDESRLVNALREGGFAPVSLIAEVDGLAVGHILFSQLKIVTENGIIPALALAPMAVLPDYQRTGIGSKLVQRGIDACRGQGQRIVIVLGHPNYYPRFGFSPELALRLDSPYAGEAFMALELVEGALHGVTGYVEYAPPFDDFS